MEKIIWTIAALLLFSSKTAPAQCSQKIVHEAYVTLEQQLLEGATQQAQGTLFTIRDFIHCHTFTQSEYQNFLFFSAIYHHLLSDPQLAEHYFMGSNPSFHSSFGETIQNYAQSFTKIRAQWPQKIHHSRFHLLMIDGQQSTSKVSLSKGTHLIQLVHKQTKIPLYAQWLTVDERVRRHISLPRNPPKWPLYLAGTKSFLAGYSFWMAHQKWIEAQKTNNSEDYQSLLKQRRDWLISGGGFSILGVIFFGVYYVW